MEVKLTTCKRYAGVETNDRFIVIHENDRVPSVDNANDVIDELRERFRIKQLEKKRKEIG